MLFKRIKELREDRDFFQKEIAEAINCTQQQYSEYETGKRLIQVDRLIELAKFYRVSTDYILGLTDEIKPYPFIKH